MAGLRAALALACVLGVGVLLAGCAAQRAPGADASASVHIVRAGENLYRIGKRYGVSARQIQQANGIADVTSLQVGQRLRIPAAGRSRRPRTVREPSTPPARSAEEGAFRWPLEGTLTSAFGSRGGKHEGIDIAAPRGTTIVAARSGKVIFAGRLGDYGNMIVVKHAGSLRSVYAHVRVFLVRQGSFVESGQRIAEVGATGNASGPHLHFEIRERDQAVDPLRYLP